MKIVRMAIRVWLKVIVQGMIGRKFRSNRWQRRCSSDGLVMMLTGGIC